MRKVAFRVANSLDNYIARQDGSFDWILQSEESRSSLAEFWKTIDTVLWGRKTYELVKGRMPAYKGVKNYVFSRTRKESADPGVELIYGEATEFVQTLKKQDGPDIFVMGGGELATSLFEAELIACKTLTDGCVLVSYRVKG